ncbi:MAG: hypothetical protein AAFQ94_29805 [Bacteroidota bacterium]
MTNHILQNCSEYTSGQLSEIDHSHLLAKESELISKYFNKSYLYLEPFFSQDNGFYTVFEMHNRLVCVMGESNCCQVDKSISRHAMLNMIRHKIIQSGTRYQKAITAVYDKFEALKNRHKYKRKVALNLGIVSYHKLSGVLEFVGNGVELNYYRKNQHLPMVFRHANDRMQEDTLLLERIEANKGDRFFIQKHAIESLSQDQHRVHSLIKSTKSFFKKSINRIKPVGKRNTSESFPINASMMLAFTL